MASCVWGNFNYSQENQHCCSVFAFAMNSSKLRYINKNMKRIGALVPLNLNVFFLFCFI